MRSKAAILLWIVFAVWLFSGCTAVHRLDLSKARVVTIPDEMSEEVARSMQAGETVVFRIPSGGKIPLKMAADLEVFTLEPGENTIVFNRDVYLWAHGSGLRISPDGEQWADLHDMKSIKKLFGLGKGSFSLGFHMTKEQGAFVVLEARDRK